MSEIPKASRLAVIKRDRLRCQRCNGRGTDWHHRRSRRVRGIHQHCPCNGILLCRTCHDWVHSYEASAKNFGFIVSAYVDDPGGVPLRTWIGVDQYLTCDGRAERDIPALPE